MFINKKVVLFVYCMVLACSIDAQPDIIHREWIAEDSIFIDKFISKFKDNPRSVEALLLTDREQRSNLGFGYSEIEGSNGKGYVSLFYDFIFLHDRLVCYSIVGEMPADSRLTETYTELYHHLFKFNTSRSLTQRYSEPLYYGYRDACKPINSSAKAEINDPDIEFFMTPFSGTMYGVYGGDPVSMLDDRKAYNRVKKRITPEICELLLYSINPATRLTAIEYYYQHIPLFKNNSGSINQRIEVVFKALPKIETMSADLVFTEDSRKLVQRMVAKL